MVRGTGPRGRGKDDVPKRKANATSGDDHRPASEPVRRRPFLKLAGAAAAAVAGVASSTPAGAAEDYETWTVTSPEVYLVSDDEVISNVLIDQTHPDGSMTFVARNTSGWELRNIGFLGVGTTSDSGGAYHFQVSAPAGGHGLIENVYMYGKDDPKGTRLGGIFLRRSHAGHVDIRHTYIEGFGNNAVYGSNPGQDGGGNGSVTIENAYHRDNTVGQFRIGTPGSVVRNCLGIVNNPPSDDELRGDYISGTDNFNARGIWARRPHEVTVENSAFYLSEDDLDPDGAFEASSDATLNAVDCHVNADAPSIVQESSGGSVQMDGLGNSPSVDVIGGGGVPLSPEMAASGQREMPDPPELGGSGGGSTTEDDTTDGPSRTLTIDGQDAGWTDYAITVSGDIENNPDVGTFDADDAIEGSTASGFVNGGVDGYLFSGEVTDATVDGDAPVLVDGQPLDLGTVDDATGPAIDRYEVTEAGSRNPAANILVEWDLSDADGDLASATVDVVDAEGTVLDETTTSISGDVAYGVDYFRVPAVDDQTMDVRLTVTDAAGNQATATRTVTE